MNDAGAHLRGSMRQWPEAVLFISKPMVPPWNDSGKNLARDLAGALKWQRVHVMGVQGEVGGPAVPGTLGVAAAKQAELGQMGPNVVYEPVYSGTGSFGAGIRQNLAPLRRLLTPDDIPLYHFFFAPNPRTSLVARSLLTIKRRATVHTMLSAPASYERASRLLFADRTVALSHHTKAMLEQQGVQGVVVIPPCVPTRPAVSQERKLGVMQRLGLTTGRPFVLFAGDYEYSSAASTCSQALESITGEGGADFVFACRMKKGHIGKALETSIREGICNSRCAARVFFFNEVDDMDALIAAATVQVMPADSLYAKMDIPLVLLESLREGVPVVVADHGPLPELLRRPVGSVVPVKDPGALAAAVNRLLGDPEMRASMGREGQALVDEEYSPAAMASKYRELYKELLDSKGIKYEKR